MFYICAHCATHIAHTYVIYIFEICTTTPNYSITYNLLQCHKLMFLQIVFVCGMCACTCMCVHVTCVYVHVYVCVVCVVPSSKPSNNYSCEMKMY